MFYIADAYTTVDVWGANLMAGRRIPMAINAKMSLKFYLYGSHTFTTATVTNALKAEW
jgi:hypothetical protein